MSKRKPINVKIGRRSRREEKRQKAMIEDKSLPLAEATARARKRYEEEIAEHLTWDRLASWQRIRRIDNERRIARGEPPIRI